MRIVRAERRAGCERHIALDSWARARRLRDVTGRAVAVERLSMDRRRPDSALHSTPHELFIWPSLTRHSDAAN